MLAEEEKQDILTNDDQTSARQAYSRKSDFEKHGYTDRCAGCSAILRGTQIQPHSGACQSRMEQLLEGTARVQNAKMRLQERAKRMRVEE